MIGPVSSARGPARTFGERRRSTWADAREALDRGDFDRVLELVQREEDETWVRRDESDVDNLPSLLADGEALLTALVDARDQVASELEVVGRQLSANRAQQDTLDVRPFKLNIYC